MQVSMLWESVDPTEALRQRFGFTDAGVAARWLTDVATQHWGAREVGCERLVVSASNLLAWLTLDGRRVVAKCAGDPSVFSRLAEVDAIVAWAGAREVPVAAPVPATHGQVRVQHDGLSVALHPYVEGSPLDVDDPVQVETAGRMLAALHLALATYPRGASARARPPGTQLVHGDFRSANLLHDGTRITAVLDFDEARVEDRVTDLARACVLLGTRYHDWVPTSPATRRTFVAAYEETAPLDDADRRRLDADIGAVLDHFGWARTPEGRL